MKNKTVLFISKGEKASPTRYRALDYFPLLLAHGWQPLHVTDDKRMCSRREILRTAAQSDTVVVLRRAPSGLYAWRLRQLSKCLVFDFDDAIFLPRSGRFSGRPARFRNFVKRCDCIWAGNSYLADAARPYNDNVRLVPTSVDISHYQPVQERHAGETILVWIGSRSTGKYLTDILPVLEQAASGGLTISLKVIADFELHSDVLTIYNVPWSRATEARELALSTIGIAPMREDSWTRGKCGLKVLQYMAAGLPVITSPYGVNKELVKPGVTGLHAENEKQWIAAIESITNNLAQAMKMGSAGRSICEQHFNLKTTFKTLLQTLDCHNP